jgi:predicted  nucleic acid-binding Zn-ribbon protein
VDGILKKYIKEKKDASTQLTFNKKNLVNETIKKLKSTKKFYYKEIRNLRSKINKLENTNDFITDKDKRSNIKISVSQK